MSTHDAASTQAQEELRDLLLRVLRRLHERRGLPTHECEDLVHEGMLKIRGAVDGFRGESKFTTWAIAITNRVAFDRMRARPFREVAFDKLTHEAMTPLANEDDYEAGQKAAARAALLAQLAQVIDGELTEKQRRALVAELGGMPQAEIARHMGMSRNALYKLAHDARRRIRARLESTGVLSADIRAAFEGGSP